MSVQLDVGSWGLFCGNEGRQIVRIDDQPLGPSSARKYLRRVPRALLLTESRIADVYRTEEPISEDAPCDDALWQVRIEPIFSPRTHTLIGVLAGVFPLGVEVPPAPIIGSWEWEIER